MERASSSTACSSSSSSSSPAAPPGEAFPAALTGNRVELMIRDCSRNRNISMVGTGTVMLVADGVCLKVVRPKNPHLRLRTGYSAELSVGGRQWSGPISWVQHEPSDYDDQGFYDFMWIDMVTSPESAKNVLVTVNPVRRPKEFSPWAKVTLNVNQTNESSQAMVKDNLKAIETQVRVKVGVNGFGGIERLVLDMALQSLNMEVVAICSPVPPEIMVKVWKIPNVSISVKDEHTVIFEKSYHEWSKEDPEKKRNLEKLEQMEVTVFRSSLLGKVDAHFVVEFGTCYSNDKDAQPSDRGQFQIQVPDEKENLDYCFRFLPQALNLRELYVVEPIMRAQIKTPSAKRLRSKVLFDISPLPGDQKTSSEAAAKDVNHKKVVPDLKDYTGGFSFIASTVFLKKPKDEDISRDPKLSNLDVEVTIDKSENCCDTDNTHVRLCATAEEVGGQLIAIMSLCLDIVRCLPVGGCHLKLT